jgi:hypothetical protein
MKMLALRVVLGLIVTPAGAQSLQVVGYAGVLGEWELSATVTGTGPRTNELYGPLSIRHTGLCTQDGPEEKAGDLRFQLSSASSRLNATLRVDGIECRYSGKLADSYSGTMTCPDRPAVPLRLWVR